MCGLCARGGQLSGLGREGGVWVWAVSQPIREREMPASTLLFRVDGDLFESLLQPQ